MIKKLDLISSGLFKFKEGTLYPILHNLEKKMYIESFWLIPDTGRKKYYKLTKKGILYLLN